MMLPLLRFRLLELTFRSDLLDAIPDPSLVPNRSVYTKTDHITVTKTDPSLLIFGGGNF